MTKTRSSFKVLACLMAIVTVLFSFAISASAMETGAYTPELSGLPSSHSAGDMTPDISRTMGSHVGGVSVNSTLTLSE